MLDDDVVVVAGSNIAVTAIAFVATVDGFVVTVDFS